MIRPAAALACLFLALPVLAQSPAERLRAAGEVLVEGEFDLAPIRETYSQGAGPRAGRAVTDLSAGSRERYQRLYRDVLERLAAIPPAGLSPADRTNHALLKRHAETELEEQDYPLRDVALATPNGNPVGQLVRVGSSSQALRTGADFEAWLSRVEATGVALDQAIAQLKAAAAQGWTTPRALVQATLRQVEPIAARPAKDGPFWGMLAGYPTQGKRAEFERRYSAMVDDRFLPALRRFTAFLRDDYLAQARTTSGLGALPKGDAAYRTLIRGYTTLDLAPADVHALGLAEVARIRAKLLEVARSLGFKGEMREFSAWVESNPANYPFKAPEEVLAYLRRAHSRVEPELPKLFHRLPRSRFEIRQTPPAVAASASATYSRPLADGSRPGIFHIPIVDPAKTAAFSLTALLMHEGMPGHHLDIGRAIELDQPRFRKVSSLTVYSEGWGLYAESLGQELGAYDDPWALLGRYAGEIHRAARLVVDTGLHWKGWSREQSIRYLVEERGQAERNAIVATERYMGSPGQALAYKIGELEIQKLRAEAQQALGPRFDLRDFHEAVLGEGQLSLDLLGARVRAWIATRAR